MEEKAKLLSLVPDSCTLKEIECVQKNSKKQLNELNVEEWEGTTSQSWKQKRKGFTGRDQGQSH